MTHLTEPQHPIVVIGAAAGDIVMTVPHLPASGEDLVAEEKTRQIGGCAFNVLRGLCRLNIPVINGIIVGEGPWGDEIRQQCNELGTDTLLHHTGEDNGWCLALVEPDAERTFISVAGCESRFTPSLLAQIPLPPQAIIYLNGYELIGEEAHPLREWTLALPSRYQLFVDLGPRLAQLSAEFLQQLWQKKPILTLNRQEVHVLCGEGDPIEQASYFAQHHQLTIISRLDRQGAWLCKPDTQPQHCPIYPVNVVDTIGAGDAHCAGVLAGLSLKKTLTESVDLGNQVAAVVVSRRGPAGAPFWHELDTLPSCTNPNKR